MRGAPEKSHYSHPLPGPAGYPADGWHYPNQHGFVYQVRTSGHVAATSVSLASGRVHQRVICRV